MALLARIKVGLDRLLEAMVAAVMAILVLDVLWQVFTRFVLRDPSSWTEELATFLMVWIGLLGSCVALNRGAHLGMDYFVQKLPPQRRVYVEMLVFLAIAAFSAVVLGYGGIDLVVRILHLGQVSPALGIRMGYVYLALPISGFFLTLYSLLFFGSRARLVTGRPRPGLPK